MKTYTLRIKPAEEGERIREYLIRIDTGEEEVEIFTLKRDISYIG